MKNIREYQEWLKDCTFAELANPEEALLEKFMQRFDLTDENKAMNTLQTEINKLLKGLGKHG